MTAFARPSAKASRAASTASTDAVERHDASVPTATAMANWLEHKPGDGVNDYPRALQPGSGEAGKKGQLSAVRRRDTMSGTE